MRFKDGGLPRANGFLIRAHDFEPYIAISAGDSHTIALMIDGSIVRLEFNELGTGPDEGMFLN